MTLEPDWEEYYSRNLLRAAECLRSSVYGFTVLNDGEPEWIAAMLRKKLDDWAPSTCVDREAYDDAVEDLIGAALVEYDGKEGCNV